MKYFRFNSKKIYLLFLFFALISKNSYADVDQKKHLAQGLAILKEIEPNFTRSPIFLNPDENFKEINKQKLIEAIDYLEKGSESNIDDKNAAYFLGMAYSFAHDLDIPGAWQKSVEILKKIIEINPSDYKSHMILGKNYMDAEKYDEAFQEYEKVNELAPNNFALRNMAFVRMAQKRTSEAQVLLEKYIQHNPHDQEAPKILSALKQGRFEKVERKTSARHE